MKPKKAWAVQSFAICFVLNAVLAGVIFFMADKVTQALVAWVSPFLGPGAPPAPDDAHTAFAGLGTLIGQLRKYLAPALAAVTFGLTLPMWLFLLLVGGRQIDRAEKNSASPAPPSISPAAGEDADPDGA